MNEIYLTNKEFGISDAELLEAIKQTVAQYSDAMRVLIIPPDFTRCYSFAGEMTRYLYRLFSERGCHVDVIPGLGTHVAMSDAERIKFFKNEVPAKAMMVHHWQTDTVKIGTIPSEVLDDISKGLYASDVSVEIDHRVVDGNYDVIFCPGQVVPHEAAGMSGYSKSLFIGAGGKEMINKSHMLAAVCGCEQAMGVMNSPLRTMFDYAQQHFVDDKLPVVYLISVVTMADGCAHLNGMYIGGSRKPYENACKLSAELNITYLDRPAKKVVAYLDPEELRTTWVGNKAIYRTRQAIADNGELLILAPGVAGIGESPEVDVLMRKFGFIGRDRILELYNQGAFGEDVLIAGCLLIGSSNGRFKITYATYPDKLSKEEIEGVNYRWMDCGEAMKRYDPEKLQDGWNTMPDGEEIYYVGKPALGLWKCRE